MTDDLVTRLRLAVNELYGTYPCGLMNEAADRIEQLEAALNKWLHYDCGPYDSGTDMMRDYLDALDATRAAMEGKDAER